MQIWNRELNDVLCDISSGTGQGYRSSSEIYYNESKQNCDFNLLQKQRVQICIEQKSNMCLMTACKHNSNSIVSCLNKHMEATLKISD